MAASTDIQRMEHIERFLDNIDKVGNPSELREPMRSLWLRIHGEMPTMMSEERRSEVLSRGFSKGTFGDVDISEADRGGLKGSIEVISPSELGPTVEMEVEERKVTFRKADEETLKNIQAREKAANLMIELQNQVKPLSGLGGEVAKVWEGITDIARDYREGSFEKAADMGMILKKKLEADEFKKSVIVQIQKKLSEYEELGGDVSDAKARFKDLAQSLKSGDRDFISLAGEVNALAEEAIKDIVTEEVVAEVKEPPSPKVSPKRTLRKKEVPGLPEGEEEEGPGDEMVLDEEGEEPGSEKPDLTEEKEEVKPPSAPSAKAEEAPSDEEEKPVIKIVTVKKLVPVKKAMKEKREYREQVKKDEEASLEAAAQDVSPSTEESVPSTGVETGKEDEIEEKPVRETEPEAEAKQPSPEKTGETPAGKESSEGKKKDVPSVEEVKKAYEKYQFVYNASLKLHEKGRDVSQLFDLMNFAEQARKKGDMKMYVGVCSQMESMLISLQSK
ncbi:MAG: hypothetical protein DRN57_00935 [Thermoplasmata archaeon]|nr:MAG: hypothetical protein DRN57_00935 [Thermoplasmata archaeon]